MKRIIAILLAVWMAAALSGCAQKETQDSDAARAILEAHITELANGVYADKADQIALSEPYRYYESNSQQVHSGFWAVNCRSMVYVYGLEQRGVFYLLTLDDQRIGAMELCYDGDSLVFSQFTTTVYQQNVIDDFLEKTGYTSDEVAYMSLYGAQYLFSPEHLSSEVMIASPRYWDANAAVGNIRESMQYGYLYRRMVQKGRWEQGNGSGLFLTQEQKDSLHAVWPINPVWVIGISCGVILLLIVGAVLLCRKRKAK